MCSQINRKSSRKSAMKDIVCFLGSLVLGGCIVLIIVDSCESLDLHVNGYTAEATVTENLRKSRALVQFTDEAGNSQTAVINRIRLFRDNNAPAERYAIRYSPEYQGQAVVCEWPHVLVSWLVKIISLSLLILAAFALFPYSWFKKKDLPDKTE